MEDSSAVKVMGATACTGFLSMPATGTGLGSISSNKWSSPNLKYSSEVSEELPVLGKSKFRLQSCATILVRGAICRRESFLIQKALGMAIIQVAVILVRTDVSFSAIVVPEVWDWSPKLIV